MLKPFHKFTSAGDAPRGGRLLAIVWVGATTAGQSCVININGEDFWTGMTDTTSTYLGISFGNEGVPARSISCQSIAAGTSCYVYYGDNG